MQEKEKRCKKTKISPRRHCTASDSVIVDSHLPAKRRSSQSHRCFSGQSIKTDNQLSIITDLQTTV